MDKNYVSHGPCKHCGKLVNTFYEDHPEIEEEDTYEVYSCGHKHHHNREYTVGFRSNWHFYSCPKDCKYIKECE